MASEMMNGNYANHNGQAYDNVAEHNFGAHSANHSVSATNEYNNGNAAASSKQALSPGEIGWYFVEQYYTSLSKNPERLYLYYAKQSQFVLGTESEKVTVCVGQKAINARVTELDFHDCKVRVSNVDSQASLQGTRSNIVIQVLGEISNKGQPSHKFVQTFVLAEQETGFYVLNDIFRYIDISEDEEYDAGEEPAVAAVNESTPSQPDAVATPQTRTSSQDPVVQKHTAEVVDRSLEAVKNEEDAVEPTVNGHTAPAEETNSADQAPAEAIATETGMSVDPGTVEGDKNEEVVDSEKPKDPEQVSAVSPPKPDQIAPAAPPKPSGPKTWATIASGSRAARVAPVVPAAVTPAAPQAAAKAAPAPAPTQPAQVPSAPAASLTPASELDRAGTPNSSSEWQTAGQEHNRKQSKLQGGNQSPTENQQGYVKGVIDTITEDDLKKAITPVCTPAMVDISRVKSCAFVDFATPADYRAAVAANPYVVNGIQLYLEARKIRPQTGPNSYQNRGGMRGRGGQYNGQGQGQPRGGMQQRDGNSPRGGFAPRGNRGGMRGGPRGGVSQPAA